MEQKNTIRESLSFCLFGTTKQRKISLDLIEKCLRENGIDISKCENQKPETSDEALHIADVVKPKGTVCQTPDNCQTSYYHQIGDYYCSKCEKTGLA